MNPSAPFILRPVATSLLMIAIMLAGVIGFLFLPLAALPEVAYPTIQVQAFYPGASPSVMANSVTAVVERQFGQMAGLKEMSSVSSGGSSVVTLQFNLNLSLDEAEQEVQAAINASGSLLPALPTPPVYAKVNPADAPVITLAVSSKSLPITTVENIADTRIAQKISQLNGVGLVSLGGGQKPAVAIQANLQQLAAYGLNLDDLRSTISNNNQNGAKGTFDGVAQSYTINSNDQLQNPDQYRNIILTYQNGAPVRLSDVATVTDGAENNKLASWADTTPAILINVQRQPNANVIAVVDQIKAILPQIQAGLPGSVDPIRVLTDRTNTIRASVADVEFELVLAVVLVVLVIYVFLRSVPATFIPSLSVPLSIVGTFACMYELGFSLNNLSLMALTISTGFVVDDAIVMIENISRYLEQGEKPFDAAMKGAGEIGFTIMSLTISLIAVLIPLLFMQEVVGRLFREFAVTLAVTILISAVVSLTLVPMLCAKLLKPHDKHAKQSIFHRKSEEYFDRVIKEYDRLLTWVLDHQPLTMMVAVGTLVLTIILYIFIPKGFFPLQDTGFIQAVTSAGPTVSFDEMARRQQALASKILADKDVASLSSFIGVDGTNNTLNSGRFLINLKDKDSRDDVTTIMNRLAQDAHAVPGITFYMQPVQDLTIDSVVSRAEYQFQVQAADPASLDRFIPKLIAQLQTSPALLHVSTDYLDKGLSAFLVVDRDTAARFGLSAATVDNALYDAFGQRQISTIYTDSSQNRVILEADPRMENNVQSLSDMYLPSSGGGQVPMSAIARVETRMMPLQIDHLGQFPSATISFDVAPGYALGSAVDAVQAAENAVGVPPGVSSQFEGAAVAFQSALGNEVLLIFAALITVYIVLGVLYESFIHPLTILSTLPSAGVGALLALMITSFFGGNGDLNIVSIIGIILLIGIVKKNAIMMIDFALEAERHEGKSPTAAIHQAALLRFRPILMTTMAALFGALPLMLGTGMGSELRHPLGISIVGGLLVSQLLTLFTTPVIYIYFDRWGAQLRAWRARNAMRPAAAE